MKWIQKIKERLTIPGWLFAMLMVVYGELLLHVWTAQPFVAKRFLAVMAFALAFGALLAFLISLIPQKAEKWVTGIVTVILSVLYLMEYFIDDAYQYFMPLSVVAAGAGGVATGFLGTVLQLLGYNWWRIALYLVPIVLYAALTHTKKSCWRLRGILAAAAVVLYGLSFGIVYFVTGEISRMNADYNFDNAVTSFGLNMALPLDFLRSGSGADADPEFVVPETKSTEPTESTEVSEETDPIEQTQATEATEPPVVYEPHAFDLDFTALAESETNSKVAAVHSYVASLTPAMENQYTGLFEGKNLILITAEAFTGEFLDPELTPALWRMANEGIKFTDYYQPIWGAGTTGGEYSNVVGLMPNGGECMMEATQQNLFLTMGKQLQKLGYSSAAYHNNDYTYYDRHKTHTLLGYDYFMGYGNGIEEGVSRGWPESDLEMIDFTIPKHLDQQPFSLYYMTVSGHSTYSRYNDMAEKNYDAVKDLDYSEPVKCYIACNLELEYAMESLIRQLEEAGIADDTVVVISADHYPYGLAPSDTWGTHTGYLTELFGEPYDSDLVRDRNTLIIWSGCLEDMDIVVDDPVYSLDILPTLSNLFGVDYDSRLLPGRDVFSDTEPLVFWPSGSWKTNKGAYDQDTGIFTPAEGVEVEEGYTDYIRAIIRNKVSFSRSVAWYDYYDYVVAALETTEEAE